MEVQTGPAQLPLRPLATHESPWAPDAVACALNARLDARLVPSEATPDGLRVDYAHVVVLDNFLGEGSVAAVTVPFTTEVSKEAWCQHDCWGSHCKILAMPCEPG